MVYQMHYPSPIGTLCIQEENEKIIGLFPDDTKQHEKAAESETPLLRKTHLQLEEYFAGKRTVFDIPIEMRGTDFQKKVWSALQTIPYGETRSYDDLAKMIGNPKACRAVGGANNKNRIIILIPCHRVIGANGSLVGFGCGLNVKEYLLTLEG